MTPVLLLMVFGLSSLTAYLIARPSGEVSLVQRRALMIRRSGLSKSSAVQVEDEELSLPFFRRVIDPILQRFYAWVHQRAPSRLQESTRIRLAQAGSTLTWNHFVGLRALLTGGLAAGGAILLAPTATQKPAILVLMTAVLALFGWQAPEFWLSRRITARRRLIDRALPDVLDLLSISVEAGLGLDGAIQKVGEKFPEPTSGEFRELLKSIRLGTARTDALRALADRTGLADVRSFTAAVIQAEQLGVSIARVLRAQSEAMRVKRKQKVEEKAMALPLKMLFPLIIFIFPTVFIVVLGPVVISFITTLTKK